MVAVLVCGSQILKLQEETLIQDFRLIFRIMQLKKNAFRSDIRILIRRFGPSFEDFLIIFTILKLSSKLKRPYLHLLCRL